MIFIFSNFSFLRLKKKADFSDESAEHLGEEGERRSGVKTHLTNNQSHQLPEKLKNCKKKFQKICYLLISQFFFL